MKSPGSRYLHNLLLTLLLLVGASSANAGLFCSGAPFFGVIDGNERAELGGSYTGTVADPWVTQITIDTDCTFLNFPASNPLTATLNFQTNDPSIYLITFDGVVFTGNMACANIDHRIWFVNGSDYGSNNNCQDLFIPVEAINKQNPAGVTTVGIGDPFTYTLNIPVLYDPATGTFLDNFGSANDLHSITIVDDLNATGADLTVVGTPTVTWLSGPNAGDPVPHTYSNVGGLLTFEIDPTSNPGVIIPAGDQLQIAITVVADNTNAVGTQFVNTATWSFGRLINIDLDGDGIPEPNFFDPLPGENGVTDPLTIGGPELTLTKTNPDTALNVASTTTFTLDIQNTGSTDAWNATVLDLLPYTAPNTTDMCEDQTPNFTAEIFEADGVSTVSGPLVLGVDYSVNNTGAPSCEYEFTMLSSNAVIGPSEHLIITYDARLDNDTDPSDDGTVYNNYAGVTQWYSGDPAGGYPVISYTRPDPVTGTPGTLDHEDTHAITAALTGYIFQKTVENVSSGVFPATIAFPGDTLRYRLRLFNFTEVIDGLSITDTLDPALYDLASFNMVTPLPDGIAAYSFNATTGELQIFGDGGDLDLDPLINPELIIEFEIDIDASLANGTPVPNQALAVTTGAPAINTLSDDPYVNGVFDPLEPVDPVLNPVDETVVTVQGPGALLKENPVQTSYTISEQFTYTITVPDIAVGVPLYDVRILDDLTAYGADLAFVSATDVSGHGWTLSNTGTSTNVVIEDTGSGIDIPANEQAIIEVTVQVQNTLTNQQGNPFSNRAFYTYNRVNGDIGTQSSGVTDPATDTTTNMTVVEPNVSAITKTADNTAPTAGETVRYSIDITADSGANISDVFDVQLVDSLNLGLVYAGNPTVTVGAGVGADNTIGAPDITGDGINTAQILEWNVGNADIDIQAGETITIAYDVRVDESVLANQDLDNSVVAQWSSLDGSVSGERTGIDGNGVGALNNYATSAVIETLTIADIAATILKEHTGDTDTYIPGDDDVRIGDLVEYTITLSIPEGTLGNLQLVDTLPQGLDFEGVVSINGITAAPYTAVAPFSHADIPAASIVETGNPATDLTTTVTWNLGDVNNQPVDDTPNDFVIVYRARVMDSVLAQANSTPLNNTVTMSYDTATTTVNQSDIDTVITVLQPDLSVAKSASAAGGDIYLVAGEVVTYTVDITNNGLAPAYDVVLEDTIPDGLRNAGVTIVSSDLVSVAGYAPMPPTSYSAATGMVTWNFDTGAVNSYIIPPGDTLRVEYTVQVDATIADGLALTNAALVPNYYSFDNDDRPEILPLFGTREIYGPTNTATSTLYTSSPPTKALITPAPAAPEATIGDEIVYEITVPGSVSTSTIYDVQITDALDANLEFVSVMVTGGVGVSDTSIATQMNIAIDEIPAGTQAVIELHARVRNVAGAIQGGTIDNTVSYTYAYTDGGPQQPALPSIDSVTVTITEPDLTAAKLATAVTPAPITGGDIIEYAVTLTNNGDATAYDVNVVDTLPVGLSFDTTFIPTATIGGVPVVGFVATPSGAPAGPLVWGRANGDDSLDIPVGSSLVLTYRVLIDSAAEANNDYINSVLADWSSQDGVNAFERTGAGCPAIVAPNEYCSAPATETITIADSNSLTKTVINDSYAPVADASLRIGDTATYRLSLNIQEGTTRNVVVSDVLPAGLAFDGIVSINGDTTPDYTAPVSGAGSNFSYATITAAALPALGQTGALTFTLGDVVNDPLGDATTDTLVIEYQVVVQDSILAPAPSTVLSNTATLQYIDGGGAAVVDPARLESSASLTVWQPVMTVPIKTDAVFTSPANVDIVNDVMQFTLESCNTTGLAPAYSVQITDILATQLDETSIVGPTVTINGVAAVDGVDYNYTPPAARGGSLVFDLITPVNPGECVTINYDIGFHTDFGPNQSWNNSVTVDEYWSLPLTSGEQYASLGPTTFSMNNAAVIGLPAKSMTGPASGEATIGEEVVYQITVPAVAANAAIFDVVVTDVLNPALEYISATDVSGYGLSITDNTVGNNVSLSIAQIPAGQQAIIELRARVANNAAADASAPTSFTNTTDYTYAETSGGVTLAGGGATTATSLTIVEPEITINKTVTNVTAGGVTPPTAGDLLRYTLTFTASGTGVGDIYTDAFDITIDDNLSLGLAYQAGSATVDGAGNTIGDPFVINDGITAAQVLTWQLSDATADIDVTEGTTVTVTYDVLVLDNVQANQDLTNSAIAQWTSLDGISADERTGTGVPAENDYVDGPATTLLTTPDTTTLAKTRLNDTWGPADGNVRVGDIVEYELRIGLQEGQHTNVSVSDTLPQGLSFEEIAHINGDSTAPYSAVAPFIHNDVTSAVVGNPVTDPTTTVTFTIGDITNVGDNNAANDEFVIVYRARVLDSVHTQQNSITLTNNAQVDYTTFTGATSQVASSNITLLQPNLSVAKNAAPAGGDNEIVADEIVTYTVNVLNGGTAPAYDLVLQDTIPIGMRNGTATITMVSTSIGGVGVANLIPTYDPVTGIAVWDFDTGVADAYTIGIGETMTIVYQVQADADLGAGMTLTNSVTGTNYYSFDDDAVPTLGTATGVREIYGPTNTAIAAPPLTSPMAGALDKANPADTTVTIGETFTYTITVPATPIPVALHDVRIVDDISFAATGADLSFVSVAISGSQTWVPAWTPTNTGTPTSLVIEDPAIGIDIPAGEQAIIEVTVRVDDTGNNVDAVTFQNTADYTFNQYNDTPATQQNGLPDTTGFMTIVEPNQLNLMKTGPPTIRVGLPGTYTLDVHNTGTSPAYDVTIEDILPDLANGGMCDTTPYNITAQMYDGGGVAVGGPLVLNTDYTMSFITGATSCDLTFTTTSSVAAIPADHHLVISYDVMLDNDSANNVSLTNIAGATEWFSQDTAGAGATGETRTYTRTLNDAVTAAAALDHEDAFTTVTESPTIQFRKYVVNTTTGQDPGTDASPGDVLHYRIEAVNVSPVDVPVFSIIDELDALNASPMFVSGSMTMPTVTVTGGTTYTNNSDINGGANGTGLVDIQVMSMSAAGGGSDTVTIEFDITLADVIDSGTLVFNQAQLQIYNLPALLSDDVNVNGAYDPITATGTIDPTQTLIASASLFQVQKTSEDIDGSATELLPGDTLRYTITVKNIGNENAVNATLQDTIPADTTYETGSTTLNGVSVADVGSDSPLLAGMLINAPLPEDQTPGFMRADADPLATNVATITFDVTVNADAAEGAIISNQAILNADGAGTSGAVVQPSDDPVLNGPDDPTVVGDEDPTTDVVSRPNGAIYDSISRQPLPGVTVRLLRASDGGRVPESCFSDPAQQDQVTTATGFYKFSLENFDAVDCPDGADYLVTIIDAPQGYDVNYWPSRFIPPTTNATTAAYDVDACPSDAVGVPAGRCEALASGTIPTGPVATPYYLHMTFGSNVVNNATVPPTTTDVNNQIFNNHIPMDSEIAAAISITKTTPLVNVTRGELVPYTITLRNTLGGVLQNMTLYDQLPPGFKYVEGSGRFDGSPQEPVVSADRRRLQWNNLDVVFNETYTFQILLVVSSGVSEGEYVNQAWAQDSVTGGVSDIAAATVRVVPDPTMDCSDVIGKVYDDRNLNGYQDEGEPGIGGVRVATARGLLATTDKHGRFHVTCAVVPDEDRGSNFILKVDERTLPTGYRVTTENPRVQRVTRGKMARYNFGATVHHVVTLSVADGVFQSGTDEIRPQWLPRLGLLMEELRKQASVLRITYLADVESKGLVDDRMATLKANIQDRWENVSDKDLEIEAEIFWRHGGPVGKGFNIFSSNDVEDYVSSIFARDNFGEDTERQLPHGYRYTPWMQDPALFEKDDEPKFEIKQVTEKKFTTRKLTGLVPPILFKSGKADISEEFVIQLREILNSMRDRTNVRLHFIGHTDDVQLRGELKRQYEDNMGLSKERAGTTAEFFQRALELPPESISYEGLGETSPVASNDTAAGRAQNRRVEVQVWYDEVDEELVDRRVEVDEEIKRVMVCRVETVCKLRYKEGHSRRAKLKNLVPPFHYDEGVSEIPAQYLQQLRQALQNLSSKDNVQMRFIAYTDNIPLTGRDARIYGDHVGLSKANARRVAIAVQEALGLPNAAIASTGRGSIHPVASNNSEKGRALNRRIEVEFWHDDPLEDLPDEPQICPEASAAETVERIYNPPEGDIQPIYFENGQAIIPDGYTRALQRAMDDIQDKGNVRLRFIGYTSNKRLSRRTAMVYGDDIGLSTARARRAMEAIQERMGLTENQAEFEGRGYVQSHDVVNTGFLELDRSKVEVQVVYDELAVLDEQEGVSIKRLIRDVETRNPFALNLMRISVDGQPINDPNKNIPDVQRCTDVALDKAQVRFKFDNLQNKPRLNVTAWPNVISHFDSADTEFVENLAQFKLYSNYPWAIDKAEVRIFKAEQSTRDDPLAVVAINEQGRTQWQYNEEDYTAPRMQLKYVLRVYDKQGNFDETSEQTLWVVDVLETDNSEMDAEKALLVGYGENRLGLNNIPLHGGTVRVYGEQVPEGHKAWFAGYELPVSEDGKFGGEYIIPSGLHTVEVSITDDNGNGHVYQRDLELENSDWFYVGIADVTVGIDDTNGPADIVTGDEDHYNDEVFLDGRLAFYAKGKFANEATLTTSADTREGPIGDLFSNFMDKTPEALFRRLDPDYYYPTFGDDSTVEDDAPTSGKFYVKYQKDKNYGMWGNFDIAYTENNLAHVDRGLYGANANYESDDATGFGEKRYAVNLFAAEPGTVAGRDEFLGTGGSLYFLRHQDILPGSERIRIETRDAVSGMVTGVKNLAPGLDYTIDYIQGRIMLTEPVSASAVSGSLVDSSDFGGVDVMVVARYEYTPGFDDFDEVITGGRAHYWFNEQFKLGMTAEDHGDAAEATSLNAYDLTWRKNAGTWLRIESSTSQGPVSSTLSSSDGGYSFTESALLPGTNVTTKGQRVDASVRLEDVFDGIKGKFTIYNQQLDAGYAAPGLIALTDTTQTGFSLAMPVNELFNFKLKTDEQDRENGLKTGATELDVNYLFDDNWTFSAGVRSDSREDNSASVPLTQKEGDRTDMALRATFDSKENWLSYGYVQGTTSTSGNREDNGRVGVGGDYRFTDRFKLGGELSSGDLGSAIRMATQYKMTDTTDVYSSYALENERTDNGVKARQGNFVSGFKSRYSDSASIYMEERYTHGDVPTGLTHAMGFDLVINDALNFGANVDVGTLTDNNTGAETSRTAAGIKVGYKLDSLTFASALEYRIDETEQADASKVERRTWLSKSNLKYKLSDDWRLLAKLNLSESESSLGDFFNGSFTEAILGYAYRPVSDDALNALFKYTYFYNLPTTGQVSSGDTTAQYIQKSQIVSLDASYDITKRWTLGGKYAYRFGELSFDREDPEFFESNAALSIVRVDWHFTHRWDALVEMRKLELPQADDSRSGMLIAIYRHFGNHIKLGAGYNFTDFSDDLTDLDYDSKGLFINAIGKF